MRRVIVESPYAAPTEAGIRDNEQYLRECLMDCVARGEVPFASHAFFTFFLNDQDPKQRELGIRLGYDFWEKADKIVFYTDKGMSPGMKEALAKAFVAGYPMEHRQLHGAVITNTARPGDTPEMLEARKVQAERNFPTAVQAYAPPGKKTNSEAAVDRADEILDGMGKALGVAKA